MKNLMNFFIFVLFISGCAMIEPITVPGGTMASSTLKADILQGINMYEKVYAPNCSYKVIDTQVTGKKSNTIVEEWTVRSCDRDLIYTIELTPSSLGGTDIRFIVPKEYTIK